MAIRNRKLSDYGKYWLLKKISHYYREDACLRLLNSSILLYPLQKALDQKITIKQLIDTLKKSDCDTLVSIPRKSSKDSNGNERIVYFDYPPLSFQVESLFYSWPSISRIFRNSEENLRHSIQNQNKIDATGIDLDKSKNDLDTKRHSFGNKANFLLHWESTKPDYRSIQDHEQNLGYPLQIRFAYEYASFSLAIQKRSTRIVNQFGKVSIVQSDLQSFYHNLEIDYLIHYFSQRDDLQASSIISC